MSLCVFPNYCYCPNYSTWNQFVKNKEEEERGKGTTSEKVIRFSLATKDLQTKILKILCMSRRTTEKNNVLHWCLFLIWAQNSSSPSNYLVSPFHSFSTLLWQPNTGGEFYRSLESIWRDWISICEGTEPSSKWLMDARDHSGTKEIWGDFREDEDLGWNEGRVDFVLAVQSKEKKQCQVKEAGWSIK